VQTFVLGRKAVFAAEAYVLGLFQLYPTVYFHKATRGAEKIGTELLARVIMLIKSGSIVRTGLPKTHPLVKFAKELNKIDSALALDDTVIWGALSLMCDGGDECIRKLAERLRDRKLYKCIDVRAEIAHRKDDGAASSSQADTVCASIRDEIAKCLEEWSNSLPDAPTRILIDEVERSPYKSPSRETHGRSIRSISEPRATVWKTSPNDPALLPLSGPSRRFDCIMGTAMTRRRTGSVKS
jgi:uncharacterized protein